MAVYCYDMSLSSASLLIILNRERTKRTTQQTGDEMVGRQQRLDIAGEALHQQRIGIQMQRLNDEHTAQQRISGTEEITTSTIPSLVQSSSS